MAALGVVAALLPAAAGITIAAVLDSVWPAVVGVPVTIVLVVMVFLISTTLRGVLLAATYKYAATGVVPTGFDDAILRQAFKPKVA